MGSMFAVYYLGLVYLDLDLSFPKAEPETRVWEQVVSLGDYNLPRKICWSQAWKKA